MKKLLLVLSFFIGINISFANIGIDSLGINRSFYFDREIPLKAGKELTFIAYFFNQAVRSNYYPRSAFFQGQSIGRLFGRGTAITSDTLSANYVEQRLLPFFIYTPKLMDGRVTLRASFEIDWTWGDAAYGAGGNQGAGFNADFVNLQTQNVELEIIPAYGWAINFGLLRSFDTPYHPYRTTFGDLQSSGFRLMYWSGDAAGINVRKDFARGSFSVGAYNLWENKIELKDDSWLYKAIGIYKVNPMLSIGAGFHFINDNAQGAGGASILGSGPKSLLTEYIGAYHFVFPEDDYVSRILWSGLFFEYNKRFTYSKHRLSGFFNHNSGGILKKSGGNIADINGFGANLTYAYRFGNTEDDKIGFDALYTTGDKNGITDGTYNGVITGNTWGAPGNLPISTGSNIIFPSGNVVNRYMPMVTDISNIGAGLAFGALQFSKALIPHKYILTSNACYAMANESLPDANGKEMGIEANLGLIIKLKTLMEIELRGAHVWLGDFYDSPTANGNSFRVADEQIIGRPANPWLTFVAFKWLMF